VRAASTDADRPSNDRGDRVRIVRHHQLHSQDCNTFAQASSKDLQGRTQILLYATLTRIGTWSPMTVSLESVAFRLPRQAMLYFCSLVSRLDTQVQTGHSRRAPDSVSR